jgi:ABC-2 type transport system permease protein
MRSAGATRETPASRSGHDLSVRTALTSEVIKFRSLRSLVWLTVAGAVVQAVLGPVQVFGLVVDGGGSASIPSLDAALSLALTGMGTACVVFGILGVLTVTSELPSRTIHATFIAVPRRGYVVVAKMSAFVAGAGTVAVVASAVAVAAAVPSLTRLGWHIEPLQGDVIRVVIGAAFYLVMWGCYGQLLGWLLRSTVGATMALFALFFVLPALTSLLPGTLAQAVFPFLPSQTPSTMVSSGSGEDWSTVAAGVGLSVGYVVVGMVWISRRLTRRDA